MYRQAFELDNTELHKSSFNFLSRLISLNFLSRLISLCIMSSENRNKNRNPHDEIYGFCVQNHIEHLC